MGNEKKVVVKANSDVFIRALFSTPGNEDITLHFINAVREDEGDKIIEKALDFYDSFGQDERLRAIYISEVESERFSRTKIQEAEERGREEGREEGREIGEKIGEKREKKQSAKKMKEDGVKIESISKYTGLSVEEIENL